MRPTVCYRDDLSDIKNNWQTVAVQASEPPSEPEGTQNAVRTEPSAKLGILYEALRVCEVDLFQIKRVIM